MKKLLISMALVLPILFLTSCSSDDDNSNNPPLEVSKTYDLGSVYNPGISGTAKFIKNEDNSTTIELQLSGTPAGGMHPAHIHFNTAVESGEVALTLGTVNGNTGFSTITTSTLNDGTSISYEDLLDFDGYINVHVSADDLGTLVAQGDIGQNELTDDSKTYLLASVSDPAISGNIIFKKRINGEALATINLTGTQEGVQYPAHIHLGSVASPGEVIVPFNDVDGSTGISMTNISFLQDSVDFYGYDNILIANAYVNVHNPEPTDLSVLVAQGNIGANE